MSAAEGTIRDSDPAAALMPGMSPEDYAALVTDIGANGLREPIVTYAGRILDGRHRERACRDAGVEPQYRDWDGVGSPEAFVVSQNVHRRHLSASQRAAVAVDAEHLFTEKAKRRKASTQFGKKGTVAPSREGPSKAGEALAHAAQLVGTSRTSAARAKRIYNSDRSLFAGVKAGRMTLSQAEQKLRASLGWSVTPPPRSQLARAHKTVSRIITTVTTERVTAQEADVIEQWRHLAHDAIRWANGLVEALDTRPSSSDTNTADDAADGPTNARTDTAWSNAPEQEVAATGEQEQVSGEPEAPTPNVGTVGARAAGLPRRKPHNTNTHNGRLGGGRHG